MIIKIIKLLKHEMSSKPIAKQLHYSIGSIEHNQRLIMKKLGVKTSVGIVAYALENL
jgi:DNA-binding CsgD family transcriptional regulator